MDRKMASIYEAIDELKKKEHKKLSESLIYKFLDREVIPDLIKAKSTRKAVWKIARKFGVKRWKIWNWDSPDYTLEEMAQILVNNKLSPSLDDALIEVERNVHITRQNEDRFYSDPYADLFRYSPTGLLTYPSGVRYEEVSGFEFYKDDKKNSSRKYKLMYCPSSGSRSPI